MQKSPSYLVLQGNIYYFRMAVPMALRPVFKKREVKVSLNTSCISQARQKSSFLAFFMRSLFDKFRKEGTMDNPELLTPFMKAVLNTLREYFTEQEEALSLSRGFSGYTVDLPQSRESNMVIINPDRKPEPFEEEIGKACQSLMDINDQLNLGDYSHILPLVMSVTRNAGIEQPEDHEEMECRLRSFLELKAMSLETFIEHLRGNYQLPYPWELGEFSEEDKKKQSVKLKKLIDDYIQEKISLKNWREKTLKENLFKLYLFCDILGDPAVDDLGMDHIRFYKEKLMNFPKNKSKSPAYRDKPIEEIINMEIPEGDRISAQTVSNSFNKVRSFLEWAKNQGYSSMDGLNSILQIRVGTRPDEAKQPFSAEDLEKLFYSPDYLNGTFKQPYYFWLPLLGLFTGARIEELCQLHLNDICQVDGVWCIDINDKEEKQIKTMAGKRIIPIHPEMIERLGFLSYVESLRSKGETRLFPELSRTGDRGYSHEPSKWFSRYRKKVGVVEDEEHGKRTFHSFRHTFLNLCKNHGVDHDKAAEFAGHDTSSKDMTYGRYGKRYPIGTMFKDVVCVIDYGLDFSKIKVPDYFRK